MLSSARIRSVLSGWRSSDHSTSFCATGSPIDVAIRVASLGLLWRTSSIACFVAERSGGSDAAAGRAIGKGTLGTSMWAALTRPLCRTAEFNFPSGAERCLWCCAVAAWLLCTGTCLWRGLGDASAVPSAAVARSQTRTDQRVRASHRPPGAGTFKRRPRAATQVRSALDSEAQMVSALPLAPTSSLARLIACCNRRFGSRPPLPPAIQWGRR